MATLDQFVEYIDTDDLMTLLDGNDVLPDLQVAAPMREKLLQIANILS
jgi:hypothetical protein